MSETQYINFDAIKNDIKPASIIVPIIGIAIMTYGYTTVSSLKKEIDINKTTIETLQVEVASIQDQIRSNSDVFVALQQQIDSSSVLISGNEQDILLLANKTNTKVGGLSKKVELIEGRTLALEQAVDMPGANPLDTSILKYHQR